MRNLIKLILTRINCLKNHINYHKGMWIHPNVKMKTYDEGCITLSESVVIHNGVRLDAAGKIVIDKGCNINVHTRIESGEMVHLAKNVLLAPNVYISDRNHSYQDIAVPIMNQGYICKGGCEIGDGTWIGIHACIIGNIKIGKGCVIGANAVVTQDVPDYSVAVGNPAKIVKKYNLKSQEWERV